MGQNRLDESIVLCGRKGVLKCLRKKVVQDLCNFSIQDIATGNIGGYILDVLHEKFKCCHIGCKITYPQSSLGLCPECYDKLLNMIRKDVK